MELSAKYKIFPYKDIPPDAVLNQVAFRLEFPVPALPGQAVFY